MSFVPAEIFTGDLHQTGNTAVSFTADFTYNISHANFRYLSKFKSSLTVRGLYENLLKVPIMSCTTPDINI